MTDVATPIEKAPKREATLVKGLQILEALAPLRDEVPFRFDIMGHVWDEAYVMRRVDELGLQGRVSILGFVSEARLDAALASAHLVFNLRHPTMGEA